MVKIWCVPITMLDKQHLLGEHHELHCIYNIITKNLKGFRHHPQTLRFVNHLGMLADRHDQQVAEFYKRGYQHHTPIEGKREPYVYTRADFVFDLLLLINRTTHLIGVD